jgi:uncharacterized protein YodC (DUF2158 family)
VSKFKVGDKVKCRLRRDDVILVVEQLGQHSTNPPTYIYFCCDSYGDQGWFMECSLSLVDQEMSNKMSYDIGTVVRLRSGGKFKMTVCSTVDDNVNCVWEDYSSFKEKTFPKQALVICGNDEDVKMRARERIEQLEEIKLKAIANNPSMMLG